MLTTIAGLIGALGILLTWFFQGAKIAKLKKTNEDLTVLTKFQRIQNQGLREVKEFAAQSLKDKNAQLSKDPASALSDFFRKP